MTCEAWVLLKINEDLQTGNYDGFTSAFYNNQNATRYRTIIKEEYPGRIITPVDVDVLIQVQAINESRFLLSSAILSYKYCNYFSKFERRVYRYDCFDGPYLD